MSHFPCCAAKQTERVPESSPVPLSISPNQVVSKSVMLAPRRYSGRSNTLLHALAKLLLLWSFVCFPLLVAQADSLVQAGEDPAAPVWDPVFTVPVQQTIMIALKKWKNNFTLYYDSTTQPYGSSLYVHGKGQNDEMCRGIANKSDSDEPCSLLSSSDGWRYIIFPESGSCCRYCNVTDHCGIINRDWLVENSTYAGQEEVAGETCDGWVKEGGEKNYYYARAANPQLPCMYYEGYPILPFTKNTWLYDTDSYSTDPIEASVFDVPDGCEDMCELSA